MAKRPSPPRWLRAARAQNRSPRTSDFDWLGRAFARAGILPPAEAERAIAAGRVKINGRVQRQPLAAVRQGDRVQLDGVEVALKAPTLAAMLHKPKGVVCAGSDPQERRTVFEVFLGAIEPDLRKFGWHAAGRLDCNTTGLLLFTNDERLVSHVTSPKTHLPKRYIAKVSGTLSAEKLRALREGMLLSDGATRPAEAQILRPGVVELVLTEGRNHQVKRMLGALGLPVVELHRQAVGELQLDVEMGSVRLLSEDEISKKLRFSSAAYAGPEP